MFESIPQEQTIVEEALKILGLEIGATPDQIIDAYASIIERYRDQIANGEIPPELVASKEAIKKLEETFSDNPHDKQEISDARFRLDRNLSANMQTSTTQMNENIKKGVDGLWGMFGR